MVQTLNFCDLNSVSSDRLTCVTVGFNLPVHFNPNE